MSKQQTAVEWFINELESKGEAWENVSTRRLQINIDITEYLDLKRQVKAMEKEQIIMACDAGFEEGIKLIEDITLDDAEQYYNETYGK
jgi:hypothetical protein